VVRSFIVPICWQCGTKGVLRKYVCGNGTFLYGWYCTGCAAWAENPVHWLPIADLDAWLHHAYGKSVTDVPIIAMGDRLHNCAVCGDFDVELHHVAPQALEPKFGADWYLWPRIWVCRRHHTQWHQLVWNKE